MLLLANCKLKIAISILLFASTRSGLKLRCSLRAWLLHPSMRFYLLPQARAHIDLPFWLEDYPFEHEHSAFFFSLSKVAIFMCKLEKILWPLVRSIPWLKDAHHPALSDNRCRHIGVA
jgi:hypothetical protein